MTRLRKVIFFANTDWYLYNFRLPLAEFVRQTGAEVVLVSPGGPYSARLEAAGFRWLAAPMERRSLNPFRELRLLWHLFRLFRREDPVLVHGFTIKCAVYGSLVARAAGVPGRVGAVAGLGYVFASDALDARLLRPVVRGLLRVALSGRGSRLILQNPDDEELFLQEKVVRSERVRVILGSGVNCTRFSPSAEADSAAETRASNRRFRVILATRLLWEKGVREYVEAARILRREGRETEFLLAGSPDPGNPASVELKQVEGWVRSGLVNWLGHVEDMATILRSVDAMVLPSYYREGVPRTLLEGAASGLPLITTDTPGCREIVTHGKNGYLVPPRESEPLAAAIRRLQDDRALSRRMGMASRAKALAEFEEGLVFQRTLDVYAELVAGFGPEGAPVGRG